MGMQINTNVSALNAYRNLASTQNDLSKSLEKLSSGLRINRAADDAAGLAISEGLRSQVNGLNVAARNAQDGISVIQTAEGSLTEVHSILQRLRDLSVQAGNDSNNAKSREAITSEATQLVSDAISGGNVQAINYFVAQKYIEAFKALAEAPNQKFVMMPMESAGVIGSLGGIAELAREAMGQPPRVTAPTSPAPRTGG